MKQQISFNLTPTINPDKAVGHARRVINASTGIGMKLLKKVVEEHVPFVDNDEVITNKTIIRTERYECPCCKTELNALVQVYCHGLVVKEWEKVQGLYRVSIFPCRGGCEVLVEKLSGKKIYQGRSNYLPRKDYKSNPEAQKEIKDRKSAIAEMVRRRLILTQEIKTSGDPNKGQYGP